MKSLFRKFRQQLVAENKYSKYLLYAIGEIILVIIGILIALNINNRNEINKNEKRFIFNLIQLRSELKANIQNTKKGIIEYERTDSLFGAAMSDTLEIADFQTDDGYYLGNMLWNSFESTISNNSFRRLTALNNLDESYNPLIFKLDSLYLIKEKELLDWDGRLSTLAIENVREITKSEPWFYEYLAKNKITDEGAFYFINDPIYKNKLAEYFKLSRDHLEKIKEYRVFAIDAYNKINSLLKLKNIDIPDTLDFSVDKDILNCYVGNYQYNKGSKTDIILKNDRLNQVIYQMKDTLYTVLHPLSNNKFFILEGGVTFKFGNENSSDRKYLIWKQEGGEYKFTKRK